MIKTTIKQLYTGGGGGEDTICMFKCVLCQQEVTEEQLSVVRLAAQLAGIPG